MIELIVLFAPTAVLAAASASNTQIAQDYPVVVMSLIVILGSIVGFFMVRTLRQVDKNQERTTQINDKLFERLDNLCEEFYTLKGEHKARACENHRHEERK